MDGQAARRLEASRWLLLLALVLGVLGMHTLGHIDAEHAHAELPPVSEHAVNPHGFLEAPVLAGPPADGISVAGGQVPGPDPTSVCVAVLTVLALLLGLPSTWSRLATGIAAASGTSGPLAARPPPERTALRLARLSVLRI
ncbi:hypothetical protein GCM10009555_003150 [Acrocarpospora macrocephala]|uniref:Uncharacterized protein n=1 Tax=Acrocarpospora macrocephala TaxID=150177 RepID=A0A5M3X2H5_9ACTN|nr:DUF6153 family protein [Acrocarpospora macrocephala]GES15314.1 hypothetical protein Amac_089110 [Acrocarpospora macrocephala]